MDTNKSLTHTPPSGVQDCHSAQWAIVPLLSLPSGGQGCQRATGHRAITFASPGVQGAIMHRPSCRQPMNQCYSFLSGYALHGLRCNTFTGYALLHGLHYKYLLATPCTGYAVILLLATPSCTGFAAILLLATPSCTGYAIRIYWLRPVRATL